MQHPGSFRIRPLEQQDFKVSSVEGVPVVSAPPEIDLFNVYQLCRALWAAETEAMVVVVDMTATMSCDTIGVDYLIQMKRWLENNCVELRLVGRPESLRRIMATLGEHQVLPIFSSLAEAINTKPRDVRLHYQAA